jgi:hypothetical protein
MFSREPSNSVPLRRRWLRFSLRTFLLSVTVLCVWLGMRVNQARRQKDAVAVLRDRGATIYYAHQRSDTNPRQFLASKELAVPHWLRELAGDDFFQRVATVELSFYGDVTDKSLIHLVAFPNVESLIFPNWAVRVTDAGLVHLPRPDRLVRLSADGTSIGDGLVTRLANASRLEYLDLGATRVTTDGIRSLVGLANLKFLSLSDTNLGDDALAAMPAMPLLDALHLDGTRVTDAGLAHLARHKSLRSIVLNRTAVTDAGLKQLARLPTLRELSLARTQIRGAGLRHVAPLVEMLILSSTAIDDAGLAPLTEAKRLKSLELFETAITDAGLVHLHGLPKLNLIGLDGTKVTHIGIKALTKAHPTLTVEGSLINVLINRKLTLGF